MDKRRFIIYITCLLLISFFARPTLCLAYKTKAKTLLEEGRKHLEKSEYNIALNKYLEFTKIEEKQQPKDTLELISTYCNIGGIYSVYQNFAQARDMYEKAFALCKKSKNNKMMFETLNNLVGANCNIGNAQEAEKLNEQVFKLSGIEKGEKLFYYYFNKGFIANCNNKYAEKAKWMTQAINMVDKYHLPINMKVYPYSEIYQSYEQQGELEKALDALLKYEKLAQEINQQSLTKKRGQAYLIVDCYKGLMRIYTKMGNKEKALQYQNAFFKYNDSILNVNEFSKIRNQYQNYENEEKLQTISKQQKTIFYQEVILGMLILLVVTAIIAIIIIRKQQRKLYDTNVALYTRNNELVEAEGKIEHKSNTNVLHDELIMRINQVMNDESVFCNPEFSLATLAKLAQSNTSYVSQAINTTYNKNFRSFVNEYRIKEAMKRMKNNDTYKNYSIQGISESVGYKSVSNFIAAFKKHTGMTPSLYQKLSKNE